MKILRYGLLISMLGLPQSTFSSEEFKRSREKEIPKSILDAFLFYNLRVFDEEKLKIIKDYFDKNKDMINSYFEGSYATPLIYAIEIFNQTSFDRNAGLDLIRYLIKQGADIEKISKSPEESPIFLAIKVNASDVVELLLSFKPDIIDKTAPVSEPLTPVMYAVRYNKPGIMKLLILKGADLSIKAADGKTVKDLIQDLNDQNIRLKFEAAYDEAINMRIAEEAKETKRELTDVFPEELIGLTTTYLTGPTKKEKEFEEIKALIQKSKTDKSNLIALANHLKEQPKRIALHDELGYTPFLFAVYTGNLNAVQLIVTLAKNEKISLSLQGLLGQETIHGQDALALARHQSKKVETKEERETFSSIIKLLEEEYKAAGLEVKEKAEAATSSSSSSSSTSTTSSSKSL